MALPNFGLITKTDKQKLDAIPSGTLITTATAASVFLAKADSATYITSAELQSLVQAAQNN